MNTRTTARLLTLALTTLAQTTLAQSAPSTPMAAPMMAPSMPAAAAPTLSVRQDAKLGTLLTGPDGRTLYTFTRDAAGVSNCNGPCALNWPPLLSATLPKRPAGLTGHLSLITRADGARQVAYDGQPLYFWKNDVKPGDATGQGFMGVWFAANAQPTVQLGQVGALGSVLTGPDGRTLYTFAKDAAGVSNCTGMCATNWPPLLVSRAGAAVKGVAVPGALGTLTRADGSVQVTYQGHPLYFWKDDAKPGDATGEGFMNVWHAAHP